MRSKRASYSLLAVLVALVFFLIARWQEPKRKEAFDRAPETLRYSAAALCSMNCKNISRQEVEEIMKKGIIHLNRTNRRARPCPLFALQGETTKGKKIRVIFAQCVKETEVVDCLLLYQDTVCECP